MNKKELGLSGDPTAGNADNKLAKSRKVLPRCMDWIVFAKPGKKKRKPIQLATGSKPNNNVTATASVLEDPKTEPEARPA